MQGLLQAALPQTAPAPLSSTNLASHTRSNPPAPRRTVTHYVLQQAPYVSRTAQQGYEIGPPPSDEFEGVKTPPRAKEAGRKRALEEVEGYESGPRKKRKDEALVLHADDGQFARPQGNESAGVKRKKPLLAMQLKGRSSSASATPVAGPSKPPGKDVEPSASSSFLVPRAGALEVLDAAPVKPSRKAKGKGKENEAEPARKASPKRRKGRLRAEAEEADELDEVEERLRARRERCRERALIRKDRTVTSAAVGAAAASKVTAAQKKRRGDDVSSGDEEEGARRKSKRKRESKEEVARRKVQEMDKPSGVKAGRLTLKPAPLGIFNKGKASVRTKVGKTIGDLAFSELAFLDAPRCEPSSPSSASSSSSSSSRSNAEDVRLMLSAARRTGPRTYGSGRRGSARASKHFAALIDDVQPASSAAAAPTKTARTRSPQPNFWVEIPSRPASSLARQRQHLQPAASVVTDEASTHPSVLSAASLARRRRATKDPLPTARRVDQPREAEEFPRPTLYAPLPLVAGDAQGSTAEGDDGDFGGMNQADHDVGGSGGFDEVKGASETEIGTASLARILDEVGSEQPDGRLAEGQEEGFAQLEAEEPTIARSPVDEVGHDECIDAFALGDSVSAVHAVDSLDFSASFVDLPASASALLFDDGLYLPHRIYDAPAAHQTGHANFEHTDCAFPPISSAASSFAETAFNDVPTLGHSTTLAEHGETNRGGMYADDVEFREAMRRQWPKARC